MTSREKEILNRIKENPLISQQKLADQLKINRSSVAVHIGNLMKKGYIKGKGYIVEEEKKALIIGGANIDLEGSPCQELKFYDSNPGRIETSQGGVGRNIAENLARLSIPVRFLTALGEDLYGEKIFKEGQRQGMDMDHVLRSGEYPTSMYLSLMDEKNDMRAAISQMDILTLMDPNWLKKKKFLFKDASVICIDGNLTKEAVDYIVKEAGETPIFADPVSTSKIQVFEDVLEKIHTFKPNRREAEKLLGMTLNTLDQVRKAGERFLDKGISHIYISLGEDGVYTRSKDFEAVITGKPPIFNSATGAGDAFMAGVIYGFLQKTTTEETLKFAMGAAFKTLSSEHTIHPNFSGEEVIKSLNSNEFIITYF
ncbi:PfkB family carbohydrate kinase [Isachenkonia alkalipeptolytica]|uniref:Winged helix-turn-helix transcriptional regulator n=1 Tax=Isachenkonia alkalipeptolytica TaxID=2565777 RepID=A0AA44BDN0_9CLOT|nr:PfkB family carbohydrate kinase [Isachenkonia alkalipeptolytica]NBG88484.1 winged helix-turn-helix transcriptional regulator [Isachenkonia alkalipeptolytica]